MVVVAVGRVNATGLDGVTVDAHGTLVQLVDPVPALAAALAERNAERPREVVAHGFKVEVDHYVRHSAEGHDEPGLARLQRDCASVFLEAVGADLDPDEFAPVYAGAMHFELLPGVVRALEQLRALGLELAVVANWDLSLRRLLDEVGLSPYFRAVVHAARKPAPDGLVRALELLGVDASRALHVGDDEADELAAAAAGMRFASAPLTAAVAALA
jgi:putative hydrolase of the HAD superfamily